MKKTYIIPQMDVTVLATEQLIADSPNVTINKDSASSVDAKDVDVKSSRNAGYNVWNEDWSE